MKSYLASLRTRFPFRASTVALAALVSFQLIGPSDAQTLPVNQLRQTQRPPRDVADEALDAPRVTGPVKKPVAPNAAAGARPKTTAQHNTPTANHAAYLVSESGASANPRTAASSVLRQRNSMPDRMPIQQDVPPPPVAPRAGRAPVEVLPPETVWMPEEPMWSDDVDYEVYPQRFCPPLVGRVYASAEVLSLWTKGMDVPTLVTTSPATTPQTEMGVLGQPGTTVLFGGQALNTDGRASGRVGLGLWIDPTCGTRVEASYLFAGDASTTFTATSPATPVIARPFQNVTTGAQDAVLVAIPSQLAGSINVTSTTQFNSLDILWRKPIAESCDMVVDFTLGYRHSQLSDTLAISDSITALVGFPTSAPVIAAGTNVSGIDQFQTTNRFNGAQIGFACEMVRCRWSYELLLNLALGNTSSDVSINGSTATRTVNGATTTQTGNMLALPSNIGQYQQDNFSAISELGLRMNYDLAPRWRLSAAYTLIYWSQVARAGNQVDTALDPNQFPVPNTTQGSGIFPEFHFHFSDFWAQGVGLRLEHQF